ncbi:MAG TPA: lipoate protein ligase C-terminal domain-containing protein [Anaerolineae bacterium]|nr:lipoate protein ligase C-terminal domain-containing protein [Anaerolineae bacterium]HQH37660.1 lipoate protein ligase C-terminal domain-containing protein [Anaerolineae bacterium]
MPTQPGTLSADYKAGGGKLWRVRMTVSADAPPLIQTIELTGDFFMHPEEAIEDLERLLTGVLLDETALRARVEAFFAGEVQVVGADVDDVVAALLKAA